MFHYLSIVYQVAAVIFAVVAILLIIKAIMNKILLKKDMVPIWNNEAVKYLIKLDSMTLKFVDLGLPSGKLWANENVKKENGDEDHFTFDKAVETFGKSLPSMEDWKELFDNSSYSWNEERKGYDVTGPNGNAIFLPAAGCRFGASVINVGSNGNYWSSTPSSGDDSLAYFVCFDSGSMEPQNYYYYYRYSGFSVRLVR